MKRTIGKILAILLFSLLFAGAWASWWLLTPLRLASDSVELSIEPGNSPREVASAWVNAGVQSDPRLLYQWFRWSGQSRLIRAGSYEIHRGESAMQLLQKMVPSSHE